MTRYAFDNCVDIPVDRSKKPREVGLNFTGDWGRDLVYVESMLKDVGEYLDMIKTAVLTARLCPYDYIKRKVALYHKYDVKVFPGGMTLEGALICKKVDKFFEEAKELGFDVVEVSESMVRMTPATRLRLIEMGVERGFQVVCELGPHHATEPFSPGHIIGQCKDALSAGAWKIVLEGAVLDVMKPYEDVAMAEKVMRIADEVGVDKLIFEGGDLRMIQWLVLNYGPDINLGNLGRDRLLHVEHVRRGLNHPGTWFGQWASL